jgi:hypothetical protein
LAKNWSSLVIPGIAGEQFIPEQLKPSTQDDPTGPPQSIEPYQPTNQAVNTVQYHW